VTEKHMSARKQVGQYLTCWVGKS